MIFSYFLYVHVYFEHDISKKQTANFHASCRSYYIIKHYHHLNADYMIITLICHYISRLLTTSRKILETYGILATVTLQNAFQFLPTNSWVFSEDCMKQNMDALLQRGESLDALMKKSQDL